MGAGQVFSSQGLRGSRDLLLFWKPQHAVLKQQHLSISSTSQAAASPSLPSSSLRFPPHSLSCYITINHQPSSYRPPGNDLLLCLGKCSLGQPMCDAAREIRVSKMEVARHRLLRVLHPVITIIPVYNVSSHEQ